jgi:uncharacterized protein (TIGR02611 family)
MIRRLNELWERMQQRMMLIQPPQARRIIVAIVGFTVLLLGIVMLVLPGPALLVIPAGLAILALEFSWARVWLDRLKAAAKYGARKIAPAATRKAEEEAAKGRAEAHESFR